MPLTQLPNHRAGWAANAAGAAARQSGAGFPDAEQFAAAPRLSATVNANAVQHPFAFRSIEPGLISLGVRSTLRRSRGHASVPGAIVSHSRVKPPLAITLQRIDDDIIVSLHSKLGGQDDMMAGIERLLGRSHTDLASATELKGFDIPDREQDEDRSYLSIPAAGLSFVLFDHIHIGTIQAHADGHEGFIGYSGPLPLDLDFATDRVTARDRLGFPQRHGEPSEIQYLGSYPAWDLFDAGTFTLHLEYEFDERSIRLVSISSR